MKKADISNYQHNSSDDNKKNDNITTKLLFPTMKALYVRAP